MIYTAYLHEQAKTYRELSARAAQGSPPDAQAAAEYSELAEICDRVAFEAEDHAPAG
jgi:hypothetical protein